MNQQLQVIRVKAPTLTTENTLTTDLRDFGFAETEIQDNEFTLVNIKASNGAAKSADCGASVVGNNLVIAEGGTGFATGDEFTILVARKIPTVTGVASS